MDNIGNKLEEILNDPGSIKRIMDIAETMGLSGQVPDFLSQEVSPDLMQRVSHLFQQTDAKDKQQQTLIRALLPYLSPKRRARLEHAMQLSHISRLAGAAMRNDAATNPIAQEEELHV